VPHDGLLPRDSKRNCLAQNNDQRERLRRRLHEGPPHTSLPLLALPLPHRPEGLPLSTALGGDPASLLRALSHQTPGLGPHVLDGQQGSNGNRTGTRTPPKPGSQPVTPPRFATDHRLVSGRVSWCALQENPRSILATYKVSVCGSIAVSRLSAADPGFDKDQGV
jgi:hypothetical protein